FDGSRDAATDGGAELVAMPRAGRDGDDLADAPRQELAVSREGVGAAGDALHGILADAREGRRKVVADDLALARPRVAVDIGHHRPLVNSCPDLEIGPVDSWQDVAV